MNITFRQIDAFRKVVSTGTVTDCAQLLGISQPAVSRLLSDMEKEIGFKLFTRSGRNLEPTIEARLLVEEVRRAICGLEKIKETAKAIGKFQYARLRIITTPTFSTLLTPELIRKFSKRQPEAMISLEIQSTDDTVEWMVSDDFDFGIVPPTGRNSAIMSLQVVNNYAVCILPSSHRLADLSQVTPKDLEGENFISYLPDSIFKFEIDEVFRKASVERRLQYEARTTDALCRLVAEGLGVSIVGAVSEGQAASAAMKVIPFFPGIPFRASLIWSRRKTMSAIAEDFLQMVNDEVTTNSKPS